MFEKFKNRIITLEGADGTGKDTVTDILQIKYPNSYVVRFPDRTNITGNVLNRILKKEIPFPHPLAFQSLMMTNKVETLINIDNNKCIKPKLFFFCRYYESAMVYGLNDSIPADLSYIINSVLPKSEMTFVLDGKKYRTDNEYYEQTDVQINLTRNYRILSREYNWNIVNNERTPDEIADDILEHIEYHMENIHKQI